jgi:cytochrome c peroxidase
MSRAGGLAIVTVVLVAQTFVAQTFVVGQTADPVPPPSLKTLAVPEPDNLSDFVADRAAAIRLGKALFWDMQVGSDGIQACATCHFHAGADGRVKNQMSPGLLRRDETLHPDPDTEFSVTLFNADGSVAGVRRRGPNHVLTAADFPFRLLSDPLRRDSVPLRDTNDVASSQGVFAAEFRGVVSGQAEDVADSLPDATGFQVGALNVRRVEPRQTPSVINAVFNVRNFWDGRAQNEFNGVNIWGGRDAAARVYRAVSPTAAEPVVVRLTNASLASQAVGPPLSGFEMSADGRALLDIGDKLGRERGRKLVALRPLGRQLVHPDDSVLGGLSRWPQPGLAVSSYETMIRQAFRREWWQYTRYLKVAEDGSVTTGGLGQPGPEEYTLMEYNFGLFFGLAVQLYEATLVSDESHFDRFREGRETLSDEALRGMDIFLRAQTVVLPDGSRKAAGRCIACHAGPEFTDATVANVAAKGETLTRGGADFDRGWSNIGVRPTLEDLAVGGNDAFGSPLSVTRLRPKSTRPVAADGAFKAPSLRNVELTAPYFHNGGQATLEGVVEFYSRGGDLASVRAADGTALPALGVLGLTPAEQAALVAFLKTLTDERVRYERAPFDHPQLFVPDGHPGDDVRVTEDAQRPGQAEDALREIPAVGRQGGRPLPAFLEPR